MSKTKEEWEEKLIEIELRLREERARFGVTRGSIGDFAAQQERVKGLEERVASLKTKISELATKEAEIERLRQHLTYVHDQLQMEYEPGSLMSRWDFQARQVQYRNSAREVSNKIRDLEDKQEPTEQEPTEGEIATSPKRKETTTKPKVAEFIPKHKTVKDGVDKMLAGLQAVNPAATLEQAKRVYAEFTSDTYENVNKAYHYKGKR